jgi:murein tripeptide amidase MpaA
VNTGVPEDLVIRCNPSGANLVEIVRNTNENEAKRILAGIEGFLSGDEFPLWVSAAVNLEICTKIDEFVRSCA